MSLPNITFIKGKGGLGRTLPGEDYISGIIFYDDTKPTGFNSGNSYVEKVLNLSEAEALGILDTNGDETLATATLVVTNTGASNDTLNLMIGDVDLGTYTSAGSLTTSTEATAIAAQIQSLNYSHGYSASASGATITITAPSGKGVSLNGLSITKTIVGSLALTVNAFSGGVASKLAQYHYQVSEYFRLQPNGILWIMFSNVPTTYFATEINTIQTQAEGKIRQIAIFANAKTSITTADVLAINTAINTTETIFGVSLSALYSVNLTGSTISALPDLGQITAPKVSVVVSQSFSGVASTLYTQTGKSVPTLGACLGTVALAKVSDSIAWVGAYNISDGTECEVAGFTTGQLLSAVSTAQLEQLNGYRYIFLRKFIGTTGSFWNDSNCAVSVSSDYAYIENNRTIDKAIRLVRNALTPAINSPIVLNANGTLSDVSINYFKGLSDFAMAQMSRDGELSAFETQISAVQNVLATSTVNVTINIVPLGVARNIVITIGFKTKI